MMDSRHSGHPVFIDSDEQLAQLCRQWASAPLLALDTEFIRTDTFFPIAGLVQVSDGVGCFLIDPLAVEDFSPFVALLEDENIIKVLHSCGEDLEIFDCLFGVLPQPLFDTQVGAALAGMDFSMGYQRLTEELLGQHVAKGETRSNWLKRPLSDSQIHYAALDVAYLPEIYRILADKLNGLGRFNWWIEDCLAASNRFCDYPAPDQYYKKVKSAWKLSVRELAILQRITEWRELQARQRDVPRGRIIKDRACLELARHQPQSLHQLSPIDDLDRRVIRRDGETLLTLIEQGQSLADNALPPSLPKPLPAQTGSLLKSLKALVEQRGVHLNLPREMLARKKDYEYLIREQSLPESMQGWRKDVIADELLALVCR